MMVVGVSLGGGVEGRRVCEECREWRRNITIDVREILKYRNNEKLKLENVYRLFSFVARLNVTAFARYRGIRFRSESDVVIEDRDIHPPT